MADKEFKARSLEQGYFVPRDEEALLELFGRDVSRRVVERFLDLQDEE